ncbi:MAG TPA: peptidase, partial [Rhodocyclaceae bacterium]|nr:peptidase [Rhodocyclaceae bacterium]
TPAPAAVEAAPAAAAASGIDWIWPANGKLLNGFKEPSSKGIDIAGKPGDPVLAAAAGKVIYAGSNVRGYGNLVVVKHNDQFLSAYAHNRKILVKESQLVERGQKIAELGDSDADQAKLHFEIRLQSKPVDPLKYLPGRKP